MPAETLTPLRDALFGGARPTTSTTPQAGLVPLREALFGAMTRPVRRATSTPQSAAAGTGTLTTSPPLPIGAGTLSGAPRPATATPRPAGTGTGTPSGGGGDAGPSDLSLALGAGRQALTLGNRVVSGYNALTNQDAMDVATRAALGFNAISPAERVSALTAGLHAPDALAPSSFSLGGTEAPTLAESGGFNLGQQGANFAAQNADLLTEGAAAPATTGTSLSLPLGYVTGPLAIASGIQGGNPAQAIGGAAQLGSSLANLAGYPGVSSVLGSVGGPLSLASGIASGNPASIVGGVAPTLGAVGSGLSALAAPSTASLAALGADAGLIGGAAGGLGGAGGALGAAGATLSGLAGAAAIPAAVAALALSNEMAKDQEQIRNQIREHRDILQGASVAIPQRQRGASVLERLARGELTGALSGTGNPLLDAAGQAYAGLGASPSLSRFLTSGGGAESAAKIPGADTSALTREVELAPGVKLSRSQLMDLDNYIAAVRLNDALARAGLSYAAVTGDAASPVLWPSEYGHLATYGGVEGERNPYANQTLVRGHNAPLAKAFLPGQSEQALVDYLRGINPSYASSPLALRLAALPRVPVNLPEAQQQANAARVASEVEQYLAPWRGAYVPPYVAATE